MIPIQGLDHIVLRVSNLDAMLRFYCDTLGCTIEKQRDDLGLIQLRAGNALIDLVPVQGKLGQKGGAAPGAEGRNLDHFCLWVDPFDDRQIHSLLAAAGIAAAPTETRYGARGNGPSIYLQDPDGNTVELKGPAPAGT